MNILAELPAKVARRLLADWLDILGIARLDQAICARRRPSPLQALIWLSQTAVCNQRSLFTKKKNADAYMRWLLVHNIAVRDIHVENGCTSSLLRELIDASSDEVRAISVSSGDCGMDLMRTISEKCANLEDFIVVAPQNKPAIVSVQLAYGSPPANTLRYYDTDISALARRCTRLVHVNIASMDVSDVAVRVLCESCPGIEHLGISGCTAVTGAYSSYHLLTQLRYLDISYTHCTAVVMRSIIKCDKLRSLKIGFRTEDSTMQILCDGCPNLTDFAIPKWTGDTGMHAVTTSTMERFVRNHVHLRSYVRPNKRNLLGPESATDDIGSLAQYCPRVEEVDLTCCVRLDTPGLIKLVTNCPQLRRLGLSGTRIADEALIALGANCPLLEMLLVRDNYRITDTGVIAVARGCPRLQHFDAEHCENLTGRCATALAMFCRDLRIVRFGGCNRIILSTLQKTFRLYVCAKLSLEHVKNEERKVVVDYSIAAALLNHQ
jgi:hypothetical protein